MKFVTKGTKIRIENSEAKKLLLEATVSVIEKDRLRLFIEDEALKNKLSEDEEIFCRIVTKLGVRLFESIVLDLSQKNYIIIDYNPNDYKMFQRRQFLRVNANIGAVIIINNDFYKVKTVDLGGGGIRFYSTSELPVNKNAQMRIRLNPEEPFIIITGKILKNDYFKENEYLFFFTEINEHQRSKIMKKCIQIQSSDVREVIEKNESND